MPPRQPSSKSTLLQRYTLPLLAFSALLLALALAAFFRSSDLASTTTDTLASSKTQQQHATMSKTFDAAEVKKHTSEDSCWIVMEGQVFDVTEWLEDHPGGKKILIRNGGKDATEAFWTYHSEKVWKQAEPYKIGDLKPDAKL